MANQEQYELLLRDVKDWNTWRGEDRNIVPNLSGTNLSGTNLSGADLSRTNLSGADLSGADLSRTNLSWANLSGADLSGADLSGADLSGVKIWSEYSSRPRGYGAYKGADLSGADLSGANLTEANLSGADLSGADLTEANLTEADLNHTNLTTTNMSNVKVWETHFTDLDLRTVKGLETLKHRGPSHISITTLYRSAGQIPDSFLRKAGVPEDFLVYLPSLVNKAIEYYTCFISYSSKDQAFVERLYADLQSKGVRCWYAPEDLKIGDKIRQRIDESIRLYDKLLLVLSEHSVASEWVEFEVETALEKERKHKRTVLFPIRLDDHIKLSDTAWAADIRRTRHIGKFIPWKDHDAYQQGLQRLLRDLKAETPPAAELH